MRGVGSLFSFPSVPGSRAGLTHNTELCSVRGAVLGAVLGSGGWVQELQAGEKGTVTALHCMPGSLLPRSLRTRPRSALGVLSWSMAAIQVNLLLLW